MGVKEFLDAHIFYPNMIYTGHPAIQQMPKFIQMPLQQNIQNSRISQNSSETKVKLDDFRNRAVQLVFDLLGLSIVYVSYGLVTSKMVFIYE